MLCALAALLAGCAFAYRAQGSISGVAGEMRGKAFPGNAVGGGRFILESRSGSLRCDASLTPPDQSATPGECSGEQGAGEMRCTDGRVFALRWQAKTCRSVVGGGDDGQGGRVEFQYSRSR